MKKNVLLPVSTCLGIFLVFSSFSCEKESNKREKAEATISGTTAENTVTGTIKFTEQRDNSVKMELKIQVPQKANQSVAVHLHEHGSCGNAGADAHGHWNPTNKPHGKWGTGEYHAGDIGNITLDAQGNGKLTLVTNLWTIGGSDVTNIVGRGVIVHGGVDDYTTQPAGNSGPRIGCGVIQFK